jgi:site-specific DNA recombinase
MNPKKTAIYTRSATKDGEAIASQINRCRNHLKRRGLIEDEVENVQVFTDDGVSGTDMNRPALEDMMAKVGGGEIDLIVFADLARISRNLKDFLRLQDEWRGCGVHWASVTEKFESTTDSGELVMRIMTSLNEFEQQQSIKHGRT